MLMYIDKIRVYAPANNKCRELGLWADERYSLCLTDGRALERIFDEIRERMSALDGKYPRTGGTFLHVRNVDGGMMATAKMDGKNGGVTVFYMVVWRVEARYLWSDGRNMPVYYGRKEEEEYRRACERRKGGRR